MTAHTYDLGTRGGGRWGRRIAEFSGQSELYTDYQVCQTLPQILCYPTQKGEYVQ